MTRNISEINKLMNDCYYEFRNRWCEAKNRCACLGCVNVHFNSQLKLKGIELITKEEWVKYVNPKHLTIQMVDPLTFDEGCG